MAADFGLYRIFYYAARYGNITYAARALFQTQPTVSRSVAALERELGCVLFRRSKKGVSLTPEGELLFQRVEKAYGQIEKAEEELAARCSMTEGTLRVGASETTLHHYLLPYLEQYRRDFPGIRLKISIHSTPGALQALRDGTIDFAVVTSPGEERSLRITRLASVQDIVIAGRELGAPTGRPLELEELTAYPLIALASGTRTRQHLEQLFADQGLALRPDIEVASTDLIVPVVEHNLGIGFVPREFAEQALGRGAVVELSLKEPLPERFICLVSDPEHPISVAGTQFMHALG